MLQKSKDFWRKKAQEDYLLAKNEEERVKAIESNQAGWKKRAEESSWLLKVNQNTNNNDSKVINDKQLQDKIEKAEKYKVTKKYDHMEIDINKHQSKKDPNKTNIKKQTLKEKIYDYFTKPKEKVIEPRIRPEELVIKESKAKRLMKRDERIQREIDLHTNIDRIYILKRVKDWLSNPRIPAHHQLASSVFPAEAIVPPLSDEFLELNCRGYSPEKIERVVEELKTVQEVIHESVEANKFRVPSRYYYGLSENKLHPLKMYPDTIKILLPPGSPASAVPEYSLLPNEEEIARREENKRKRFEKRHRKVTTLKPDKFDMSRVQFRIQPEEQKPYVPIESMTPMKYSQQFKWRNKPFIDDNSVYDHPHGEIVFDKQYDTLLQHELEEKNSVAEATMISSIEDTLLLDHEEEFHLIQSNQPKKGDQQNEYVIQERPLDSDHSLIEYQSELAVRSNYFSTGSTRSKPLIKIHFQRKRKFHQKNQLQIRESLNMISLKTKEKIIQEMRSKTAPGNYNPRQYAQTT